MPKKGAWSAAEKAFVAENATRFSLEELALRLDRKVETLRAYVEAHPPQARPTPAADAAKVQQASIKEDLRQTRAWAKLKDEFTDDELLYFEEEYAALLAQFKDDVFKTEEQQIRKAITLDILMRRNMASRKKLLGDIGRLEEWQAKAAKEYRADEPTLTADERTRRQEQLLNLETQLSSCRAAEQSKTREFADLDTRHQKLMEALKATREQRISKVESSRVTFLQILKDLQDEDRRRTAGRQVEMMREAAGRARERLARPHVYDDGTEDRPILSAETVGGVAPADEEE